LTVIGLTQAGSFVKTDFKIPNALNPASWTPPPAGVLVGNGGVVPIATTVAVPVPTIGVQVLTGTLAGSVPVVVYMTRKARGDGDGFTHISEDIISENMTLDEFNEHGDPSNWNFEGEKPGSGLPATSPNAPPGTLKIYERWTDEFGTLLEVHYFKHLDGSLSNVKLSPAT